MYVINIKNITSSEALAMRHDRPSARRERGFTEHPLVLLDILLAHIFTLVIALVMNCAHIT